MSIEGIKVTDHTNIGQTIIQTSPNDPTTVSLAPGGTTTLHPTGDNGPYTVAFKPASKDGIVPQDSKTATVALRAFTITQGKTTATSTSAVVSSVANAAASIFTIDDC